MHRWTKGTLRIFPVVVLLAAGLAVSLAAPVAAQASGTWARTGSMTTARQNQTAIVLHNGQVLVIDGNGNTTGTLTSAELYNPATGTWTPTGSMDVFRAGFTATVLQNGQVLVAGGQGALTGGSYPVLASAELYNPATGTWTPTGSMTTARQDQAATLLQNGQVLVAGGEGNCVNGSCQALSSAELYNPATGTWAPTGSMTIARGYGFSATLLPNGQVLVAGAIPTSSPAELYHPDTGTWTTTGSPNMGAPLAELLPNGQVLVVSGAAAATYNPATGTWTNDGAGGPPSARDYSTALLPNGTVLFSGGQNGGYPRPVTITGAATLFDPATGTATVTGSMSIPREFHTLTVLPNGQVLAAGGETQIIKGNKVTDTSPPAPNSTHLNRTVSR